jgi:hypothetical protein
MYIPSPINTNGNTLSAMRKRCAASFGGGIGHILLPPMIDILVQEKEGPEGSGRKNVQKMDPINQ